MVLSAGLGTRLRPLTDELPKPLVPVGDRPLLLSILEKLHALGASCLVVNVHYQSDKISKELESLGFKVHVVDEPEIRGTAGGVAGARHLLGKQPVLVVNGDIWGSLPVAELLAAPPAALTLAVSPSSGPGTVGRGTRGQVVRLRAHRSGEEQSGADYRGICLLSPELVQQLPERGCLIGDVAIPLLERGETVATREVQSPFWDVGSVEAYLQANLTWLEQAGRTNYVGLGARVGDGVRLHGALVGAGAVVEGSGEVRDSVIWPGAHVSAPLSGVVVTSAGLVVPALGGS